MEIIQEEIDKDIVSISLLNPEKMRVVLWNYGARIDRIEVPDKEGILENVVLTVSPSTYRSEQTYFGSTIGRVAGRISGGQADNFNLSKNEGENHLHGGFHAFDQQFWQVLGHGADTGRSWVEFSYLSPNQENGYPGELLTRVRYTLTDQNELLIDYFGESDRDTLFNPTNHAYFNLSGDNDKTIEQHLLKINSRQYLPLQKNQLPQSNLSSVEGTAFNFNQGRLLEDVLEQVDPQITRAGGLNHAFELSKEGAEQLELVDPSSGRILVIQTTEPTVVVYTGNHFNRQFFLEDGRTLEKYAGIALETQQWPNCENLDLEGSVKLKAGKQYHSRTKYNFLLQI